MPMYNLLEYSKNYRKTIGSFYNYYRDELSDDPDNANHDNIKVVKSNAFKYKNKIIRNTYNILNTAANYVAAKEGTQEIELAILLKHLGNLSTALHMPLISCEISLELKWDKNCVITSLEERLIGATANRDDGPTGATHHITDCKLYIYQ